MKKSGKLSCCTRGGAWYGNCGDPGDSRFDHTWFEGILSCKSKFIRLYESCYVQFSSVVNLIACFIAISYNKLSKSKSNRRVHMDD